MNIPVIDYSKEMSEIIKFLKKNYTQFCNYTEILNISESDRLPMMSYIWERWNYHDIDKNFFEIYQNYLREDLDFIVFKEKKRLTAYRKSIYGVGHTEDAKTEKRTYHQPYYYDCRCSKERNKVYNGGNIQPIEFIRICLPADLPKMFNCWRTETGHFDYYGFGIFPFETKKYKQVKQISFFIKDKFVDFTPEEFKKYCETEGLKYIDGTWQGHSLKI